MKLLILGGTRFLGHHLTTTALARGHEVTQFNRGNYPRPEMTIEVIQGDRHHDLERLKGRSWDAVIDTCGHLPGGVKAAAEFLSDVVERYVYISSQNAYADVSTPGVDENAPLRTLTTEQLDRAYAIDTSGQPSYGELYGGLKALSEQAAIEAMPDRVLIVRPGLIVGPDDYTDRFTYWIARVARGGEVLAPGRPERPVQFIDVRDLAEWIISMVERKQAGVYNTNSDPGHWTMQQVLDECKLASRSDATFTWASEEYLLKQNVTAWSEMPLWLPEEAAPHLRGFMFINCDRARAAGLHIRPLKETVKDTLSWYQTERSNEDLKAGIAGDKEQAVLRKWHETQSTGTD